MNRSDIRTLIAAALSVKRADYARSLCQAWLRVLPGDQAVRFDLARSYAMENNVDDAVKTLSELVEADLEALPAYSLLAQLAPGEPAGQRASALAHVLDGQTKISGRDYPSWVTPARAAVEALAAGKYEVARDAIDRALQGDATLPLLSLILLKTHWQSGEMDLALPLAKGFHDRWPRSIAFSLCLVEGLLRSGAAHQAVDILHSISAQDSASDVVNRYWGASHPYNDLWPQAAQIEPPGPIPADIITVLGMNRIQAGPAPERLVDSAPSTGAQSPRKSPGRTGSSVSAITAKSRLTDDLKTAKSLPEVTANSGDAVTQLPERSTPSLYPKAPKPVSEELASIETALNAIAVQIGSTRATRKPTHVILFSPKLLTAKFAPSGAEKVVKLIGELGQVTAQRRRVTVVLHAPEAPAADFQLKPVDPTHAWDIKMQLHDLDARLALRGQAIQSVLLIGGDDLVPFHRLPNPTDDADQDVPSDNPYGTLDDNYFVPEWMVGRLPSPCGRDPEPLCRLLRNTITAHQSAGVSAGWLEAFLNRFFLRRSAATLPTSLGYSASVWKEASREVFATIGKADDLKTSPPLDSDKAPALTTSQLSYFNLHGVEDGPNWYGQRTADDSYGPLYPVALAPKDTAGDTLPKVIYTEACYGANIINKTEPDASLCLRFLTDGVCAFVGSTRIAYGSVSAPLIGADMLGRLFWNGLLEGQSVGEALRNAKLNLAQAMHQRQNFLDGEDQKTLISFQLYGDPLLPLVSNSPKGKSPRAPGKKKSPAGIKTVAMAYTAGDDSDLQADSVTEIKSLLAHYLPGSDTARISLSRPTSPIGAKSKVAPTHRVYTVAKTVRTVTSHELAAYARVTVNKAGKVVKISVSR